MAQSTVTPALIDQLGLGERELVAFVGAGGKSTLLLGLGAELVEAGRRVILTTTTKLGSDQVTGTVSRSADPTAVDRFFVSSGPVFVVMSDDGRKITGPSLPEVDRLFVNTVADYLLVEADGARRRAIKAPAAHEPVIPSSTTLVVVVASLRAVGCPLAEVAHRPELVSSLTGLGMDGLVGPEHIAELLAHPQGGLKEVPGPARVVVALTGVETEDARTAADTIRDRLLSVGRIGGVTVIPGMI